MTRSSLVRFLLFVSISLGDLSCSSNASAPQSGTGGQNAGGLASSGGQSGGANTGGTGSPSSATGGNSAGGNSAAGGNSTAGGNSAAGGNSTTGGRSSTGGNSAAGGNSATGGRSSTGGSSIGSTGGVTGTGNGGATGPTGGAGGSAGSTGGTVLTSGGSSAAGAGGAGGLPGIGGRARGGAGGGTGGQSTSLGSMGGSSGGSTAYNPCQASPCVILPLGDSITHGYSSTDDAGYRSALFKLIVAANQNVTFTGSLSNGPSTVSGKTFPKNHEGHDGITVTGITGYVPPSKAFIATPHIVLLHIGTNDMTSNADPTTTASQLDTLVTNLVAAAPDALIVVAKIIPLGYTNTNYNSYITKIPDVVKAHAAKNQNVIMVDMSTLPTSDIRGSGNVHPTDQGYADMANLWYGAIKGYLP